MADLYVPLRAGSDIVYLGALIHHVLKAHEPIFAKKAEQLTPRERFFHDYLVHYTNAATLIGEDFQDTEDLGGLFSGFDAGKRQYDPKKWRYESETGGQPSNDSTGVAGQGKSESFSARVAKLV